MKPILFAAIILIPPFSYMAIYAAAFWIAFSAVWGMRPDGRAA